MYAVLIRNILSLLAIFMLAGCMSGQVHQSNTPLNKWQISCGVDKGSIQKSGKTRIFRTSANYCSGGVFNQRAEISSGRVSSNHIGRYQFSSTLSMKARKNEKFDIFQMHDGRDGCAPPLKVTVLPSGRVELRADYKTGPGESCIRDVFAQSKRSNVVFKRNGEPQQLDAVIDFLGEQNFSVQVYLDGILAAEGSYAPPKGQGFITSKFFYFKHGVYSRRMFEYELISDNMTVKRIVR